MRALTVQQPWAWAIIHGGKDIENRTQNWAYRGPLAIHAGMRWSNRGAESQLVRRAVWDFYGTTAPLADHRHWWKGEAPGVLGAIIGVVNLVDVHSAATCMLAGGGTTCSTWAEKSYVEHDGYLRADVVHLVLEDPRPVDPIPCRGMLGLWTPQRDVLDQLEHEGCDCTELCSMGPTCPGGMLAGLEGSGCWRATDNGTES